ncbi:MAG: metalloprotease PmbA [Rhodocyclaceae bacterium]|nr:metalloprotease PmbA [Rhodocyclaceae bacterium]MBX3668179.1 metalloprotease PmbA [Rhodocyclaceae bacterium]
MASDGFFIGADQLADIAQDALDYARSRGATACSTDVSEAYGQSVTVRKGEVESIEYNRDKGLGVTVYLGRQRGHASSSDLSRAAVHATVDAALSIAGLTADDPCAGLPEAELLANDFSDLDLYHPWDLPVENAIELAQRCEAAAFDVSRQITNSEGASVSAQQSHFVTANSLGFMGGYPASRHYISCAVIAGQADNMQRDDWYVTRRDPSELPDPVTIGDYCARRALSRLDARQIETCEVPVLFEAPLACALLGNFVYAASGGALYRKTSFLQDSLGQQIFAPCVNIQEKPFLRKGLGSGTFDEEGVATRERQVVENGVLNGYFLSVYSARKLGMRTTGNAGGAHNLILAGGKRKLDAMLELMGRGLLVTELLGHGVNYVTGDYSRGAAGYWVEGGKIVHPVHEITIAGNLRDMFRGIVEIGADRIVRGSKQTGSILIEKMKVAGS